MHFQLQSYLEELVFFFVLSIKESISLSNHIFIAPAAPAPKEIQNIERANMKGCNSTGGNQRPQSDVNTAKHHNSGL